MQWIEEFIQTIIYEYKELYQPQIDQYQDEAEIFFMNLLQCESMWEIS